MMKKLLALAVMISFAAPCQGMDGDGGQEDAKFEEAVDILYERTDAACMKSFRVSVRGARGWFWGSQGAFQALERCQRHHQLVELLVQMAVRGNKDAQSVVRSTAAAMARGEDEGVGFLSFPSEWASEKEA